MWSEGCPDEIFSNDEFDRKAEALRVLTEYYPHAKEAILMLEVFSGKRSTRAVYELRDTLDHISIALNSSTKPSEARRHFAECFTHLRRAAIEPYEWLAERKFLKIEKIVVKGKFIYKLLWLEPPTGPDMVADLKEIGEKIIAGRIAKGTKESLKHMQEANEKAEALLTRLRPKEINDRIFNIVLSTVFLILGIVLAEAFHSLISSK